MIKKISFAFLEVLSCVNSDEAGKFKRKNICGV